MLAHEPKTQPTLIWAIDPFEVDTKPQPIIQKELRRWLEDTGTALLPVHVLHVPITDLSEEENGSWVKRYVPGVQKELAGYLSSMGFPPMAELKVLVERVGSASEAADVLVKYAQEIRASWILVASKGKSGLKRLALGSFAENLLLKSTVPVWALGHGEMVDADFKRILFATDFSDESRKAWEAVIREAKKIGASLRLVHFVTLPSGMMMGPGGFGATEDYLQGQEDWAQGAAAEWAQVARLKGVATDSVVRQLSVNTAEAIVEAAREFGAGIIAMASQSGPFSAAFLGSNARRLVRQNEHPLWIFGPKWLEKAPRERGRI